MSISISDVPKASDWRHPARLGYLIIFLTFGVGGGWVAFAEVKSAVVAQGFVSVEKNSKVVQHLEGGIASEILVTENQYVDQGQIVLRLSNITPKATLATVRNQLFAALLQEARLVAERDQTSEIELPVEVRGAENDPIVAHEIADQRATFVNRQRSLQSQISVLKTRMKGLQDEINGLAIEEESTRKQLTYIDQELVGLHQLLASKLVPLSRVLALERERTRLQGVVGRSIADQAKARNTIGETEITIQQIRQKQQEETSAGILEVRQKIADLRERLKVDTDVMGRVDIRAPVSGSVQALKIYSVGQVIRPGEPLMEIVPSEEKLVVHAQFSPTDIDRLRRASQVEVRFPSFHSRTTPVILGNLDSISADRLTDDVSHQPYYLGLVSVDKLLIPEDLRDRLRAGMPAEVIAPTASRSVFSYLISPLKEAWHKSLREE